MKDIEHLEQSRVKKLFGSDSLTTTSGMDWRVRGVIDGVNFDFSAGRGGFYENDKGQYFAGIPLKTVVTLGDVQFVEEVIVTSPYSRRTTFDNPNILHDYAPSSDPDFACQQALRALSSLSENFPSIRERLAA